MTGLVVALAIVFGGDTLKTEVMFLGDMPAERAMTLWERVIGPAPGATIIQGRSPDMVVIKDTPERLQRFRRLLRLLGDASGEDHIYVRPVTFMLPSELVKLATDIMGDKSGDALFVPDDRSGQLVIRATPARYRKVDALLRKLDRAPAQSGNRRVIGVEPEPPGGLP